MNRYQQILELLLTGGYFRARINGLSPFDKILGGLAWAISASNVDVDIDVFQVCKRQQRTTQQESKHAKVNKQTTGNGSAGAEAEHW